MLPLEPEAAGIDASTFRFSLPQQCFRKSPSALPVSRLNVARQFAAAADRACYRGNSQGDQLAYEAARQMSSPSSVETEP